VAHEGGLPAGIANGRGCGFPVTIINICHNHDRALTRQDLSISPAQAGGRARDQGHFSFNSTHVSFLPYPMVLIPGSSHREINSILLDGALPQLF
jgi:hypothetical protein